MNEDVITDLKQFIATTVSQQFYGVATKEDLKGLATKEDLAKLDQKLSAKIDVLEQKVDSIQASIGDALVTSNDTSDAQLKDHERRITLLEQRPA
ncbi:MAG: hypothetical protein WDN27_06115 [Candidatus Saccharibacteria bacterium]